MKYEVWVGDERWFIFPTIDACRRMIRTYDPDGESLICVKDAFANEYLSHEEIWGSVVPFVPPFEKPLNTENLKNVNWVKEGF